MVAKDLGCHPCLAWNVAHGKRPASRPLRMALGLVHPPKPRTNWKRKHQLLRAWVRSRLAREMERM